MKKSLFISTDSQLQLCMLNNVNVEVIVNGYIDYAGILCGFNEETIQVRDGFYLRNNIKIRLR